MSNVINMNGKPKTVFLTDPQGNEIQTGDSFKVMAFDQMFIMDIVTGEQTVLNARDFQKVRMIPKGGLAILHTMADLAGKEQDPKNPVYAQTMMAETLVVIEFPGEKFEATCWLPVKGDQNVKGAPIYQLFGL